MPNLECRCGFEAKSKGGLKRHQNHCSEVEVSMESERAEIWDKYDCYDNQNVVYVIEIKRLSDGENFKYVGMSERLPKRLIKHNSESQLRISCPSPDNTHLEVYRYTLSEVLELIKCKDREHAKLKEKLKFQELCSKSDSFILGGR